MGPWAPWGPWAHGAHGACGPMGPMGPWGQINLVTRLICPPGWQINLVLAKGLGYWIQEEPSLTPFYAELP